MQCLKGLVPNIMIDFYCCCIFLVGKKEGWSPVASQTWLVSFIFRAVLLSANPPPKKKKHEATFPLSIVLAGNHLVNHTQSHSVFQLLSVCISKKKSHNHQRKINFCLCLTIWNFFYKSEMLKSHCSLYSNAQQSGLIWDALSFVSASSSYIINSVSWSYTTIFLMSEYNGKGWQQDCTWA